MKFTTKVSKVFNDGHFQVEGEGYKYYVENQSSVIVKPEQIVLLDCFLDDDCDAVNGFSFCAQHIEIKGGN